MTFEPEALERVKTLIKKHPVSMHSPYYSNPCGKTCEVCNMDKNVYDLARESIHNDKYGEKKIDIPHTNISLTFKIEEPKFGESQNIWIEVFQRGDKVAEIKRCPDGSIKRY